MNPDIELDRMPNQEEMRPNWGASKSSKRELVPLRKMYGEDYRKLKLAETKTRNIAALSIFFMLAVPCNMLMVMIWEDDISMAMCMAVLHMCMTLAGAGYLVYCWKKAEQDAKSMKIGMVYEGMAQVTVAAPLTVQYLMPEGGMVTKYAQPRAWDNFSKDMFVKVMVKDNLVIRIVKEYESITDFSQDVYVFGKPVKKGQKLDEEAQRAVKVFLLSCS